MWRKPLKALGRSYRTTAFADQTTNGSTDKPKWYGRGCNAPYTSLKMTTRRPAAASLTGATQHPSRPSILKRAVRDAAGRAQLSLVEHALCPLDTAISLRDHLVHETAYGYRNSSGRLLMANVRVTCPSGLSAADEFTPWGLLALTFAQPEPSIELHATPHYCLRKLGLIKSNTSKGGKDYQLFRDTVRRLARVIYENTGFYDPIRGEHRDVAFGFLKYSLPIDQESSRAWRFVWDQQFFEFCQAAGGGLWFDLATYRKLDFASRRLFVLLQKIFHRTEVSPAFDVRDLCVDVLGFAPTIAMRNLKVKLARCLSRLAGEGIVELAGRQPQDLFVKRGVGEYRVTLRRGQYFDHGRAAAQPLSAEESSLVDPLRAIGFDDHAIRRILRDYRAHLICEWADITLAARERHGETFFSKSAAAYFLDNIRHAAAGTRSAPDWWRDLRREELRRQREADRDQMETASGFGEDAEEPAFRTYLEGEAREAFEQVTSRLVKDLTDHGKTHQEATEASRYVARLHFLNRFRRERGHSNAGLS